MSTKLRLGTLIFLALCALATARAQNGGKDVYTAKCQGCHGATGMADTNMGKMLKVKPVTDASVKKMNLTEMVDAVRNGMGKMQAYKGKLTDSQIKSSVEYFRTFAK
ncbi:MAG: cytochrome c [Acidobacteriota bacterium]|nr:cytochrome c [Acidobacteriota bacterium]